MKKQMEALEIVTGEKDLWNTVLNLPTLWSNPGKDEENMDDWLMIHFLSYFQKDGHTNISVGTQTINWAHAFFALTD